jgi:hypothetical protein
MSWKAINNAVLYNKIFSPQRHGGFTLIINNAAAGFLRFHVPRVMAGPP